MYLWTQPNMTGDEALRLASELDLIDLLLTDVVMPGMSGPQLAATLTTTRPGLPVLFVSGFVDDAERERFVALQPMSRFLPKPFGMDQLAAAVHETIAAAHHSR